jgi:large subunit ribosomal protein L20
LARVKRGVTKHRRHKKIMSLARGYHGASHRSYKWAKEALIHAWTHAYRHRRERKGDFRRLWILRIGAAARQSGLTYSQFVHGLKNASVEINRKMLADMAVKDPSGFAELITVAREHQTV